MKKLVLAAALAGMVWSVRAGSFLVHVKMPEGNVITIDMASIPTPDAAGMFKFHLKTAGTLIVHASNVWIEEKSNKGKNRKQ